MNPGALVAILSISLVMVAVSAAMALVFLIQSSKRDV